MHINIASSAEDGDTGDWYNEENTLPGMWSLPGKQRGTSDVEEVAKDDTQHMQMTVECTQARAPEPPLSFGRV